MATPPLLRFATAGSAGDGRSALVGRLLHDSGAVPEARSAAAERVPAARERGGTADVAYRHFATARRRFVLADAPGPAQYTRTVVTGASTADLVLVLADARDGVVEQTRRHAAVAALLRVPHVVLAVDKMDLVGHRESVFARTARRFTYYAGELGVSGITAIPVSVLAGDNVVEPSAVMDWYGGPTVLEHLETVSVDFGPDRAEARFPVQYVLRPRTAGRSGHRGCAGRITAGTFRVGDPVLVLPSGRETVIAGIDLLGRPVEAAWSPQSVTLRLADDLDVSRGDLIAPVAHPPAVTRDVVATVCHLADRPLSTGQQVLLRHTARTVGGVVASIPSTLALDDLARRPAPARLVAGDIGRVHIRTAEPLALDDYADSRSTGSFLLVDRTDGTVLSAGMAGEPFTDHAWTS
ncbi:GTP-binding protein [Streptomyces sp. NPDC035033]|uniref:sulfate adenylyltransferase subunit 1 n=1 Tax=Streptomyces sp. NPDC035033 TaxID=3155368 RepID=UPI0033E357E3